MDCTKHAGTDRLSGTTLRPVEFAMQGGCIEVGRRVLDRREALTVAEDLDAQRAATSKVMGKGGLCVVEDRGNANAVFNLMKLSYD